MVAVPKVKAVDVVSTPTLTISEYFGTESSGDPRLSACVATVSERCGRAYQVPEFDEYVMVVSGGIEITRHCQKTPVHQGEGVLLKAGERVTWEWPKACQYVIVCLPRVGHAERLQDDAVATQPPPARAGEGRPESVRGMVGDAVAAQAPPTEPTALDGVEQRTEEARARESAGSASRRSSDFEPVAVEDEALQPSRVTTTEVALIGEEVTTEFEPTRAASTPLCASNIPDYIPACGLMERASSLSAFDQLLDTEGLLELRSKLDHDERPTRYGARHSSTPIVVVSSELHPWSKTGGLAMVAGSYAYEFAVRGHRTMAVSPRYGDYEKCRFVGSTRIWMDGQEHEVRYFHQRLEYGADRGCDYVFVDHGCFHRPTGLYGDPKQGGEYEDNLFRFALFTVAAAEAPLVLDLGGSTYGQEVCFIANDWQTGLLPVYLLHKYKRNRTYQSARCIMVLHNLGYQGKYRKSRYSCERFLGLPREADVELQGEDLHHGSDCINLLAAGIRLADRVLAVSPGYASEIQTPEGGLGLHHLLGEKARSHRLAGILNGISDEWNPGMDPHIPMNFGTHDFDEGKRKCKAALQRELGLQNDPDVALIGFCGRLCYQKGVHLITDIIPWLMEDLGNGVNGRAQLVLMGKGDPQYEGRLQRAECQHRGRVCGYVGFDAQVEHRMMAGCDLLLMPSQYEPCGLPQMYAQQYATVPVVHETGGLKDSVRGLWDVERDAATATGFLFSGFDVNRLKEKLYQAMDIFHHRKQLFRQLQCNAVKNNFYWPQVLDEYERTIDDTMENPPVRY